MYPNAGGEVVKDLVPIASFLIWSHVIVVVPEVPAKTLPELVAHAKANPGKLVWGYGLGSTPQILGESFKQATGIDIASIPYRGGDQARADLLGGRVHMNIAPLAHVAAHPGGQGALRWPSPGRHAASICRTCRPRRKRAFRRSATIRRLARILGPPGTPACGREDQAAVNEGLKTPEEQAAFRRIGLRAEMRNASGVQSLLDDELAKWPALLASAGIKAQ